MMFGTARKKHCRVVCPSLYSKFFDDLFITGKFNIPTQQNISKPYKGIKPMNRQQEKSYRFPPMVFPTDMCLLMGNNVFQILTVHMKRQIDFGLADTQNKWSAYMLALIDIVPIENGGI